MFCPICKSKKLKNEGLAETNKKFIEKIQKKSFFIYSCIKCKFAFVDKEVEKYSHLYLNLYDDYFETEGSTRYWDRKRKKQGLSRLKKMESFIPRKIETFLDIGCGEGLMLEAASQRYKNVYGFDIKNNISSSLSLPKINIHIGDFKQAKYENDMFDAIYLDSVLEHVFDPFELLLEINRILKPQGCLYIGVPNEFGIEVYIKHLIYKIYKKGFSAKLDPCKSPYHVIGFSLNSLKKMAQLTKFDLNEIRSFGGSYEFKKYNIRTKAFWWNLFLLPFSLIGKLFNKTYYIEAFLSKKK